MTMQTPVERVLDVLGGAGYRVLPTPFRLAGIEFEVTAALIGTGKSSDLVVVEDTVASEKSEIFTRVETIARALDSLDLKKPLTAVLVGPRPTAVEIDALNRFARVLPVGNSSSLDQYDPIKNWLSVLLPLQTFPSSSKLATPLTEVSEKVDNSDAFIAKLLATAPQGKEAVKATFRRTMEQNLLDLQEGQPV